MKKLYALPLLACALAAILLTGCHREISGTYLASDKTSTGYMQLVRTPDNHLNGQILFSQINQDGKLVHNSVPVTGTVNGENVTLSASSFFGLETHTLSGTFHGNTITIFGADLAPGNFRRATLQEYEVQEARLNAESQQILAAKAAAQAHKALEENQRLFVSKVDDLIGRMQRFNSEADVHLGRFPGAEQKLENITAKMAAAVEREHQLGRSPEGVYNRTTIATAVQSAAIDTDQLGNQIRSLQSSFETEIKPLADEVVLIETTCRTEAPPRGASPAELEMGKAACDSLANAAIPFGQKYVAFRTGLDYLNQVYQREHQRQEQLVQEAYTTD